MRVAGSDVDNDDSLSFAPDAYSGRRLDVVSRSEAELAHVVSAAPRIELAPFREREIVRAAALYFDQ
jgi:hypothetical protein